MVSIENIYSEGDTASEGPHGYEETISGGETVFVSGQGLRRGYKTFSIGDKVSGGHMISRGHLFLEGA